MLLPKVRIFYKVVAQRSLKSWFILIPLFLLTAACESRQEQPFDPVVLQATATVFQDIPSPTVLPQAPAEITEPATTDLPELSHPELVLDSVKPSSHMPFSFITSSGEEVRYLLFIPQDYDFQATWPMILSLHGNGVKGKNIDRLFEWTIPELLENQEGFPFIVISPQLPDGLWPKYIDPLEELIDYLSKILDIDPHGLYLIGFSSGGYGAWKYALRYPDRFAALVSLAGPAGTSPSTKVPENICVLKDLPIWVIHGDSDTVVPFEFSAAVVKALEICGGKVQFTIIPKGSHMDSLIQSYPNPDFYEWLLEQKR